MVQLKPGETLTGKDRIQYIKDVTKAYSMINDAMKLVISELNIDA